MVKDNMREALVKAEVLRQKIAAHVAAMAAAVDASKYAEKTHAAVVAAQREYDVAWMVEAPPARATWVGRVAAVDNGINGEWHERRDGIFVFRGRDGKFDERITDTYEGLVGGARHVLSGRVSEYV